MAERSTARSAEGDIRHDDDQSRFLDNWISRRSRMAADESEPYDDSQTAADLRWRDAGQVEESFPRSDPHAYRQPASDEPDQTYQYDQPDHAYREELPAHELDGPTDAWPVRGDVHAPNGLDADESGRSRGNYSRELSRPGPVRWRRRWLISVGVVALGGLLLALPVMSGPSRSGGGQPASGANTTPGALDAPTSLAEKPATSPSSATPRNSSAAPSPTPSRRPSARASAPPPAGPSTAKPPTQAVAPAMQPESAGPVLLGPSSGTGVTNMVQQYCDRHSRGSADPRSDGRWQCTWLLTASIVDMDVACRDTYGSGAYARTANSQDPYAWRCYR